MDADTLFAGAIIGSCTAVWAVVGYLSYLNWRMRRKNGLGK